MIRNLLVVVALATPAEAQMVQKDERLDADCIDLFNDPRYLDPAEASVARNPTVLRALAGASFNAADSAVDAMPDHLGPAGRMDLDGMLALLARGGTRTGLWFGASTIFSTRTNGTATIEGELRLGVARRRYIPGWNNFARKCRVQRDDVVLEMLRWRFGGFNDTGRPGHPQAFTSYLSVPSFFFRRTYSTWGYGVGAGLFEFRTAPDFRFGFLSWRGEYSYQRLLVQLHLGYHAIPRADFSAALEIGVIYEGP